MSEKLEILHNKLRKFRGDKCSTCKEVKKDVTPRINPYLFEIDNVTKKELLCDDCYESWVAEI